MKRVEEKNAGTYYIWYKVIGDENHKDTAPVRIEAAINPYKLEIPSKNFTYNGGNTFTVMLDGVKVDNDQRIVVATLTAYSKDVIQGGYTYAAEAADGQYTVSLSNSNYVVDAENAGTLTIEPLPVVLAWQGDLITGELTIEYDGQEHTVVATVANTIGNDEVELEYEGNTGTIEYEQNHHGAECYAERRAERELYGCG